MWQNEGFFGDLNLYLIQQNETKISDKQKDGLQTKEELSYFWTHQRDNIILSGVTWRNYFGNLAYLDYPTELDVKVLHDSNNVSDFDLRTFAVCLGLALRSYVDNYQENHKTAKIIKAYYELVKNEMEFRSMEYPKNAYEDYLGSRMERHEQERKLEDARKLGNICINCGSTNVKSYDSQKWRCVDCGRFFRKHK